MCDHGKLHGNKIGVFLTMQEYKQDKERILDMIGHPSKKVSFNTTANIEKLKGIRYESIFVTRRFNITNDKRMDYFLLELLTNQLSRRKNMAVIDLY